MVFLSRVSRVSDEVAAPALADPADQTASSLSALAVAEVYAALGTSPRGLTEREAQERLGRHGRNAIRDVRDGRLLGKLAANLTHRMALLLWVAGGIALVSRMPQLACAIWLVNLINGVFSFFQEYKAEKATEALRRLIPQHARLLRDGKEQQLPAELVVPGDILLLGEGDRIPADARLIEAAHLRADQSALTGESQPAAKTADLVARNHAARADLPNVVFGGTSVIAGTGTGVVFATGMRSEFGRIADLTQTIVEEQSPLQKELEHVTRVVTLLASGVGLVCFLLATGLGKLGLAGAFIFAMGMIVAFVPEGLLPTVTLALAMGVQRMARRQALIKRLSAVETLGCATAICTDKTGTLTQNSMTVCAIWLGGHALTVRGQGYGPAGAIRAGLGPVPELLGPDLRTLLVAAVLCNDARLVPPPPGSQQPWTALGDPTEAALLTAALKGGVGRAGALERAPRVAELPFEPGRRRMTTIHHMAAPLVPSPRGDADPPARGPEAGESGAEPAVSDQTPAQRIAWVKGAPAELLALSSRVRSGGCDAPLGPEFRAQILAEVDGYAAQGLRVLGFATRQLPDTLDAPSADGVERDLTFLGLMAMLDPPRPEVPGAVERCHRAGIRVLMVTGDYGLTAESIARQIGIVRGAAPRLVDGRLLEAMGDAELRRALEGEVIFARVAPEQKLRIVMALQSAGHVVAVTGDGVNDAPALKRADIGIAMGISGTAVAREAADMILADDNFASIVSAVEEGRAVYANIKKFVTYIFTSNTPEAVPFILFAFSGGRIPLALTVMQILSIDLGSDIVPALALGAERPEPGIMDQPPRNLHEHVITRGLLLRAYAWLGLIQSVAAMSAFYFLYWTSGYWGAWTDLPASGPLYRSATAMTLACVVMTQIGNLFAQRTERVSVFRVGLFSNRLVWCGIATELAIVLSIIYLPPLESAFGTAAFPLRGWLFLVAWAPALFLADELRKAVVRRLRPAARPRS